MKTIEIRTTQNVVIEYELATLGDRLVAFLIDFALIAIVYFFLLIVYFDWLNASTESSMFLYFFLRLVPIVGFMAYQFLFESLADGRSIGKMAMGIKVARLDGQEPTLSDYLLRSIFHLVDSILSFGVLAALLISSSAKSQRFGDLTANTTVIKLRSNRRFLLEDILKIDSLEQYVPVYPQVKNLSEKDMLLIKNVISRVQQYNNKAHGAAVSQISALLVKQLNIEEPPKNQIDFLKQLLKDYIVLTR